MKMVLSSFLLFFVVVSFAFWLLSHAPLKRNKSPKRAKMQKWSTAFFIATMGILLLSVSQPRAACIMAMSFVVIHIFFRMIIQNL